MTITEYRKSLGLSLEAFAALFHLKSKGQMSEIETANRCSPEVALAIEAHSGGLVDAATINSVVALAREQAAA